MEILIKNVELRNRVAYTQKKNYVKRDGTTGTIESRPYFTVDYKNDNGVMVAGMIYIGDNNSQVLQNKIENLADHAKLELKCSIENCFDGMVRLVLNDVVVITK